MINNTKYCLLTNDVETTSIWHNNLNDKTGFKVYSEGMPILLDLYKKHQVKSTFYFTGYIAKLIPDVVKMIIDDGHEVGCHGLSHKKEDGFDVMPLEKQIDHLTKSKHILEDISNQQVISFRAPALRVNNDTVVALLESGFMIDSSVASQRFDMFMSFGGAKKLNWLTAPRLPYTTSKTNIFKSGDSKLVEVPLSATLLPYLGTTMRIFPFLTSIQKRILNIETNFNNKPIVFDIHPNEFIDESNEKRHLNRRSSNLFSFILQDLIRGKLKVKNLGLPAISLYENEITYFKNKNYKFITVKEYCSIHNLINE